ncbi:VacJ family lipoprotein [Luteolibacter yonseiensis]|uniref:VacJ family lipoprotein n=1 Tax=Luteolibacter yonseiensis TaxID=1144680 RepID=A0A934R2G5_9BACT|nr:MlaA family lipoprotein [Luteolibacter yonseiensis]MBK1815624.1 VacJ family lipoprotein [Luteolibacter yonseiensis]
MIRPSVTRTTPSRLPRHATYVALAAALASCTTTGPAPTSARSDSHGHAPAPEFINDPLEPFNRGMWAANKGILVGVVRPVAKGYRAVVPPPARESINHFRRNLNYPGRLINDTLQGRWSDAGDETVRFLTNTTAGGLGFFDVATKWNIPKTEANFSQTFGTWGWKPSMFLVLPFAGPSDDRNATGYLADSAAEPWNYAGSPYTAIGPVTAFNRLSDKAESAARILKSEDDSYALAKYAWSYAAKDGQPDWRVAGPVDRPTLETLGAVQISLTDPEFGSDGREMSVKIPSTGRRLKFNCWIQPQTAPVVYISPGLSSHRLSLATLWLAEQLYQNGYSVVTTSSVFQPEFMENASSADVPAYPKVDSRDLHVALTEIDRLLAGKYPGRFGKKALVGCSMGGFLSLRIAAGEKQAPDDLVRFDRYVAINPPVNLQYGSQHLDSYTRAPLAWPAAERQARLNNAAHKVAKLITLPPEAGGAPPFEGIETKYLIGLTFRVALRDIVYSSQRRNNMGVLQTPITPWKREESYREIMNFTFSDYFQQFAVPYYQQRGISMAELRREGNLATHTAALRDQKKIRVITNRNDFLLPPDDLSWMNSTFGPSRLTLFPSGGHMGNLSSPPVRDAILGAVRDLK